MQQKAFNQKSYNQDKQMNRVTSLNWQNIKQKQKENSLKKEKLQEKPKFKYLQRKFTPADNEVYKRQISYTGHFKKSNNLAKQKKGLDNQKEILKLELTKKRKQNQQLSNEVPTFKQLLMKDHSQQYKLIKKDQQIPDLKKTDLITSTQTIGKNEKGALQSNNSPRLDAYKRNVDSYSLPKKLGTPQINKLAETQIITEITRNSQNPQIQTMKLELQKLNGSILQLQSKLNQKDKNIQDLKYQLKQRDILLQNSQKYLQNQQKKIELQKQLNKQQIKLKQQNDKQQKNILTLQRQLEKQKAFRRLLTYEIQRMKAQHSLQLGKQRAINFHLTSEIQRLRAQPQKDSKVNRYQNLFNGNVLNQSKQGRQYLINILEQKIGSRISKTELIYRFDPQSKANFHQYFDYKEQLVLIVRTQNDFIFGGWTEGGFIPKAKSEKSGLLFSLTNEKCFELSIPNRKAITYDEFNIIFGNSEIVIQSLKDEVYSNFGIKNGFYNCKDSTVDVMLGAGTAKEVKIKTYEIFQLGFQK